MAKKEKLKQEEEEAKKAQNLAAIAEKQASDQALFEQKMAAKKTAAEKELAAEKAAKEAKAEAKTMEAQVYTRASIDSVNLSSFRSFQFFADIISTKTLGL